MADYLWSEDVGGSIGLDLIRLNNARGVEDILGK